MMLTFPRVFLQQIAISSAVRVKGGGYGPLGGNIVFLLFALGSFLVSGLAEVSERPTVRGDPDGGDPDGGSPATTEFFGSTVAVLKEENHPSEIPNSLQEIVATNEVTSPAEGTVEISTSKVPLPEVTSPTEGAAEISTSHLPLTNNLDIPSIDFHDNLFEYDYSSLRKWGLVSAAVLFILGILILTCGKHGKLRRCRGRKRSRAYDLA